MPTGLMQTLQTQPLKENSPDPSVAGLIAAIQTMNELLLRYRCVIMCLCRAPASALAAFDRVTYIIFVCICPPSVTRLKAQ